MKAITCVPPHVGDGFRSAERLTERDIRCKTCGFAGRFAQGNWLRILKIHRRSGC
ncbi:hypothetical protein PLACP1_15060 [Planifilum fimeticola]